MVDTQRSQSALLTLLADNVSGDISPQDVRDVLVSVMGVYGDIYVTGGSTTQATAADTPEQVTAFSSDGANGQNAGVTADRLNDRLTITITGVYHVGLSVSLASTSAFDIKTSIRVDGVEPTEKIVGRIAQGNSILNESSNSGFLSLTATDNLTLWVESVAAAETITFHEARLWARLVG